MKNKAQYSWPNGCKIKKSIISNIFFKKDDNKVETTIISKKPDYPVNRKIFDDLVYVGIVVKYCCPVYSDYSNFDKLSKVTAIKCMRKRSKSPNDFLLI